MAALARPGIGHAVHCLAEHVVEIAIFEKAGWIYDSDTNLWSLTLFLKCAVLEIFKDEAAEFINVLVENAGEAESSDKFKCAPEHADGSTLRTEMTNVILPKWLARSFNHMRPQEHWILFSSFIESIAAEFIRPDLVPSYLRDCVQNI